MVDCGGPTWTATQFPPRTLRWTKSIARRAMGLFGDIIDAVEDALGDLLNDIENAILTGAKIAGTVVMDVGLPIKFIVDGVAYELGQLIGINMRSLTIAEQSIVRHVFGNTVPVQNILVTNIGGVDGRAFTIPGSMIPSLIWIIPV